MSSTTLMNHDFDQSTAMTEPQPTMATDVPPPMPPDSNKIRGINIEELNRGYVVGIGCHTFAFSTKEEMLEKLIDYIQKPAETERKWFDGKLF